MTLRRPITTLGIACGSATATAAAFATLPKCPACFSAYYIAGAGLGLSVAAAAFVRRVVRSRRSSSEQDSRHES